MVDAVDENSRRQILRLLLLLGLRLQALVRPVRPQEDHQVREGVQVDEMDLFQEAGLKLLLVPELGLVLHFGLPDDDAGADEGVGGLLVERLGGFVAVLEEEDSEELFVFLIGKKCLHAFGGRDYNSAESAAGL